MSRGSTSEPRGASFFPRETLCVPTVSATAAEPFAHIPGGALIRREVAAGVVNSYAGNSNSLGIRERLEEGVGDRKDFRKWLWLQLRAI